MGQKRARDRRLRDPAERVAEHERQYQFALRALIRSLPDPNILPTHNVAITGETAIWPCADAAVALVSPDRTIDVQVHATTSHSATEFFRFSSACAWFDEKGAPAHFRPYAEPSEKSWRKWILHLSCGEVSGEGRVFRPKYGRATVYGWDTVLPLPDEDALKDFRAAYVTRNVLPGTAAQELAPAAVAQLTRAAAVTLADEFEALLGASVNEEQIQVFLASHPEIIYPDFILVWPKLKLGDDYVTDYVFAVQGNQGREHVFVEIERADKPVITKDGQFAAPFTQAKDQLLGWEAWVTRNHAYLRESLPDIHRPIYHLIMGRSIGLDSLARQKMQSEFGTGSRRFSTYDDILARFRQVVANLLPASGGG